MIANYGGPGDSDAYWGHMGGWGGGWMWLWGMVMMALLVFLTVWIVRSIGGDPSTRRSPELSPTDRAHAILAERYARGELSTEEYRERSAELR